jgi:replicative DNA helicase
MKVVVKGINTNQMKTQTITSGNSEIDKQFGNFAPGNLYVLAGRPMMGKMPFMLNIASRCPADVPTLFFNLDLPKETLRKNYNTGFSDVFDDSSLLTETEFSRLFFQKNYALVVINYLQLLQSDKKLDFSFFKEMAQRNNTCIVLILQLDGTYEKRQDTKPTLADVRLMIDDDKQLLQHTDGIIGAFNTIRALNYNAEELKMIELTRLSTNK